MAAASASRGALLVVLAVAVAVAQAISQGTIKEPRHDGQPDGQPQPRQHGLHGLLAGDKPYLPLVHLMKLMSLRDDGEQYTKLERMLVTQILSFRDKLAQPQPDLGLPAFDPFDYTVDKAIHLVNDFVKIDADLQSVSSRNVSKFKVDNLSLYLVERLGVLDITLPYFTVACDLSVAPNSWVTPLKVPFHDVLTVNFTSPEITLGLRGKVSVQDSRISMESTKIALDLGDWKLTVTPKLSTGTFKQNPGLELVLVDLIQSMAPRLIEDWTPVLERYVNARLDDKLQDLQISDIIHALDG